MSLIYDSLLLTYVVVFSSFCIQNGLWSCIMVGNISVPVCTYMFNGIFYDPLSSKFYYFVCEQMRYHWIGLDFSSTYTTRSSKWGDVKFPTINFSGAEYLSRGNRLTWKKSRFFVSDRKLLPARPLLKIPLPLHSWRPLVHKSHIECTSSSRSQIQYIHVYFHWVNEQLTGISFSKWNRE